jgi:uncharacterized protein YndB with AHSA1/START domain
MATIDRLIDAPADEVWRALTTPETYPFWLVGCQAIRDVDEHWPQPGSAFHHRVGLAGPLTIADRTAVVEVLPGERLVLDARARPAGRARVTFTLDGQDGDRTRLVFDEVPVGPLALAGPLLDPLTVQRNRRSLDQLDAFLAVGRRLLA